MSLKTSGVCFNMRRPAITLRAPISPKDWGMAYAATAALRMLSLRCFQGVAFHCVDYVLAA
jgi:hypothetical protein